MSQATIALLIILFLGSGVAWWNSNRHDSSNGGHAGYHDGNHGGHGGGSGGGEIHFPDPQQCS
ncbi:hypothetical protein [Kushneria sp. TE3]|uniref:hypothetical protein n=1 Tax=Kushneria sp. TE3 TaxID=3449832 RepID=UPI003F686E54